MRIRTNVLCSTFRHRPDSYFDTDPVDYGDADGFAPKLTLGSGNYFFGCRAWKNCDDGLDGIYVCQIRVDKEPVSVIRIIKAN